MALSGISLRSLSGVSVSCLSMSLHPLVSGLSFVSLCSLLMVSFSLVSIGAFPPEAVGRFSLQRCGTFPHQKRAWPGLSRIQLYSSHVLLRWGTETPERPSVDWSTESSLPCDRGDNNKQTCEYPRGVSGQRGRLYLLKKMLRKFAVLLGRHPLLLALCSMCTFFFFLGFISRLQSGPASGNAPYVVSLSLSGLFLVPGFSLCILSSILLG